MVLTRKQAVALTDKIKVALIDLEQLIDQAYEGQADAALGYATWAEFCRAEIALPNLKRLERKTLVKALNGKGDKMSQREVADATGVPQSTVSDDLHDRFRSGRSSRFTPKMSDADWKKAVALVKKGRNFTEVAETFNVNESTIRNDMACREARSTVQPSFDPGSSVRHYDRTIACDLESPAHLMGEVKRQGDRLLSGVYTLSQHDLDKFQNILQDLLAEVEGRFR